MTNAELAAEHARLAEELVKKAETKPAQVGVMNGAAATAHATLAVYYQGEAQKQQ